VAGLLPSGFSDEAAAARICVMQYVIRAGLAHPRTLVLGTTPHREVPGLSGFSVPSAPGVSVDELANGAGFPHTWISMTTRDVRVRHGFDLVFPTPGKGAYHATVRTPCPLPPEIAILLSGLFTRHRNRYPTG
jgi:hypothetical protein